MIEFGNRLNRPATWEWGLVEATPPDSRSPKAACRTTTLSNDGQDTAFSMPNSFQAMQDSRRRWSPPPAAHDRYAAWAICGFLLLAVWLVFGQTIHHAFVNFDDNEYVYENSHIFTARPARKSPGPSRAVTPPIGIR